MNNSGIILGCLAGSVVALCGLSAGLVAGQSGLHREGAFWVETTSGSESAGNGDQLHIATIGNVTVRGGAGSQVTYTITRKVRAHSADEARDALQEAGVNVTRQGHFLSLIHI